MFTFSHLLICHLFILYNKISTYAASPFSNFTVIEVWELFLLRFVCKYFLLVYNLPFHRLNRIFHRANVFNLMKSNINIFFMFWFLVSSKSYFPSTNSKVSSIFLQVFLQCCTFKFMIHSYKFCIKGKVWYIVHLFVYECPIDPVSFVEKVNPSQLNYFYYFVKI